ncbi:MAG TPA: excisionase family DNA-binding protein [Candidatus Limousia pullorum]|uniref:Excisionase family DNA-binding protein n=1 Tax=Candidatus Limousia pullorum TaxID=2840860 RepID=A0A9D1S866_9FIRM|nr:excisionase family DNA-binding protein [Candidatus Limousia pullorum]
MEKIYTCKEVAERYYVKIITVLEWIKVKKLRAVKIGRGYLIRELDLIEFENKNLTVQK